MTLRPVCPKLSLHKAPHFYYFFQSGRARASKMALCIHFWALLTPRFPAVFLTSACRLGTHGQISTRQTNTLYFDQSGLSLVFHMLRQPLLKSACRPSGMLSDSSGVHLGVNWGSFGGPFGSDLGFIWELSGSSPGRVLTIL